MEYQPRLPPDFVTELVKLYNQVNSMHTSEIVSILRENGDNVEVIDNSRLLIREREYYKLLESGYTPASAFYDYRSCARRLAIKLWYYKKYGGELVTVEQARSMVRGILAHKLYAKVVAMGDTEIELQSQKWKMLGRADEIVRWSDTIYIVEFKSSMHPDIVGAYLQAMAYAIMYSEANNIDISKIVPVVVWPKGYKTFTVNMDMFREYYKRVRTVVDSVLKDPEDLPPRLSGRMSGKCEKCPYKGLCRRLPDRYRTYERYFEAKGFTRLKPRREGRTLFDYLTKRT